MRKEINELEFIYVLVLAEAFATITHLKWGEVTQQLQVWAPLILSN